MLQCLGVQFSERIVINATQVCSHLLVVKIQYWKQEKKATICEYTCFVTGRRMTVRNYAALILAAWINAVFWASMPTLGWAGYAPDPTGATCTVNWRKNDM